MRGKTLTRMCYEEKNERQHDDYLIRSGYQPWGKSREGILDLVIASEILRTSLVCESRKKKDPVFDKEKVEQDFYAVAQL